MLIVDRYQCLIFSFYREEPEVTLFLGPLRSCKFERRWEAIKIECLGKDHLEEVLKIIPYIIRPFGLLGLCRKIILSAPKRKKLTYLVERTFYSDLIS